MSNCNGPEQVRAVEERRKNIGKEEKYFQAGKPGSGGISGTAGSVHPGVNALCMDHGICAADCIGIPLDLELYRFPTPDDYGKRNYLRGRRSLLLYESLRCSGKHGRLSGADDSAG